MDVKRQHESQHLMWSLIRYYRNQTAAARALHKPKQTFNYWVNGGNIPYEVHFQMEELLRKIQQKEAKNELTFHQASLQNLEEIYTQLSTFTYSRQWALLTIFIEEFGGRQGLRSDLHHLRCAKSTSKLPSLLMNLNGQERAIYDELRLHFLKSGDEVHGRIDDIAAELFNLGKKDTYRRLKKIMACSCVPLIQAVDEHQIKIRSAAELSESPVDVIVDLLPKGKRAIATYLKAWRCNKKH